jgi:hypothetical protein
MSYEVVETIYDSGRQRRACAFRRDDGTFGFYEEHYSDDQFEQCWVARWPATESVCDTFETVLREIHGRVSWLTATDSEARNRAIMF